MRCVVRIFCFILILGMASLNAQEKDIHLKDGSVVIGKKMKDTGDSLMINSISLGKLKIAKSQLKYFGKNYNTGFLIKVANFNPEGTVPGGPVFGISNGGDYDEMVSISFDLCYFNRSYEQETTHFLYGKTAEENTVLTTDFDHSLHVFMPSVNIRVNVIPNFAYQYIPDLPITPYVGIGGGYNVGLVSYSPLTELEFESDNKLRIYGGVGYQFLAGITYKIGSRSAMSLEFTKSSGSITQFLRSEEKDAGIEKDEIDLGGWSTWLGIRFGVK